MSKSEDPGDDFSNLAYSKHRFMESHWSEEATDQFIRDLLLRLGSKDNSLWFAGQYLKALIALNDKLPKGLKSAFQNTVDHITAELAEIEKKKKEHS
jgi:hypothetical protein